MLHSQPSSTLFPYTTLFRSLRSLRLLRVSGIVMRLRMFLLLNRSSDRKSGSAGMPRPISYAVFCVKKKNFANWRFVRGQPFLDYFSSDNHAPVQLDVFIIQI